MNIWQFIFLLVCVAGACAVLDSLVEKVKSRTLFAVMTCSLLLTMGLVALYRGGRVRILGGSGVYLLIMPEIVAVTIFVTIMLLLVLLMRLMQAIQSNRDHP